MIAFLQAPRSKVKQRFTFLFKVCFGVVFRVDRVEKSLYFLFTITLFHWDQNSSSSSKYCTGCQSKPQDKRKKVKLSFKSNLESKRSRAQQ